MPHYRLRTLEMPKETECGGLREYFFDTLLGWKDNVQLELGRHDYDLHGVFGRQTDDIDIGVRRVPIKVKIIKQGSLTMTSRLLGCAKS